MKSIFTILVAVLFISIISCQKQSNLNEELSLEDLEATEGMEEAYEKAIIYNDSLIWCLENNSICEEEFLNYCDDIYHEQDGLYEFHHNNYSHNNMEDDHHHGAVSDHHHGNSMNDDSGEHNEEEGEENHGHSLENYTMMMDLRELHNSTYH